MLYLNINGCFIIHILGVQCSCVYAIFNDQIMLVYMASLLITTCKHSLFYHVRVFQKFSEKLNWQINLLLFKVILFEIQDYKDKWRERSILYPVVKFPNSPSGWSWAILELIARSFFCLPCEYGQSKHLIHPLLLFQALSRNAGLEVKQLRHELVPI